MTDENKILTGSFKSIPIRIISGSVSGGRKFIKKEFPNRDTQTIEDLGLQPRTYNIQIVTSDIGQTGQDYFDYRDSLIQAIEDKGAGVLIHPLYGRIENVIATVYEITENLTDFGVSTLSVTFETNDDTGIPVPSKTALSQIEEARVTVDTAVSKDIADNFSVNTIFTNNFISAQNKINDMILASINATSFIGVASDNINQFNQSINLFSDSVNTLIGFPEQLSQSVSGLFSDINNLFTTVENKAESFINLFGFGETSSSLTTLPTLTNLTTAELIEREENDIILNQAVNSEALSYAYVSAAQISFETVAEIESVEIQLETQYQIIVNEENSNKDINTQLTDMRIIVQAFFDEQRLSAKQVISIYTNITSVRLLSYQYYTESESATNIIPLNGITDVSFIEGDVNILTS